jgi:hypothetical protein
MRRLAQPLPTAALKIKLVVANGAPGDLGPIRENAVLRQQRHNPVPRAGVH